MKNTSTLAVLVAALGTLSLVSAAETEKKEPSVSKAPTEAAKVALCPHGAAPASCPKCKTSEAAKAGKKGAPISPPAGPALRAAPTSVSGVATTMKNTSTPSGSIKLGATNGKGRVNFDISQLGDYKFSFASTSTNGQNSIVAATGGPVKGVKVALGKNPPNAIVAFCILPNNTTEAVFKNLVPGHYWIDLEANQAGQTGVVIPVKQN